MTTPRPRAATTGALVVAFALGLAASVFPCAEAAASTHATQRRTGSSAVVQRGHARFGDCPARAVQMTVTVPDPVVARGTPVRVTAVARNSGTRPCHYTSPGPLVSHGPTRPLSMGPCGSMSLTVYRPPHHEIWPGPNTVFCPLLSSTGLAPQQAVVVNGTWDQSVITATGLIAVQARRGSYRLVVAGRFAFTVRIR